MEDNVRFIPKICQKLPNLALMVAIIHADSLFTVVIKGGYD